jgi:hypothetical protein
VGVSKACASATNALLFGFMFVSLFVSLSLCVCMQPQPNMYAAFTDEGGRAWSLRFSSADDWIGVAKKVCGPSHPFPLTIQHAHNGRKYKGV